MEQQYKRYVIRATPSERDEGVWTPVATVEDGTGSGREPTTVTSWSGRTFPTEGEAGRYAIQMALRWIDERDEAGSR